MERKEMGGHRRGVEVRRGNYSWGWDIIYVKSNKFLK